MTFLVSHSPINPAGTKPFERMLWRVRVRREAASRLLQWRSFADGQLSCPPLLLPPNTPAERAPEQPHLQGGVLYRLTAGCLLAIWNGDISKWCILGKRDAIVAPANKKLNVGVSVNRAIHNAAGPNLTDACARVPDVAPLGVKCQIGGAVMTKSYRLQVRRIIHAVGPAYDGEEETPGFLADAYRSSLEVAAEDYIDCIAFPAISCGVYGYPVVEGARIALKAVADPPKCLTQVHFVLNDPDHYITWICEANRILRK